MIKHATAAVLLVVPVALLSACGSDEQQAGEEQTTPPTTTTTPGGPPPGTERLTTQLKAADGRPVADATFDFANGFATVTVETVATGILRPGFHGMHIHSVGKCEPNSVAPTGGSPGDFNSAGGHFQAPGHTAHPASGDLTSLEVRADGSARLVTTTDSFTAADLRAGEKTALIIHEGPDNFANIPPRYTINGAPGPDQETLATGDSGARVACGVIDGAAATTTTTTTTTTTAPSPTTETTTTAPPPSPTDTGTTTVTVTPPPDTLTPPAIPSPPEIPNPPQIPSPPEIPNPPHLPNVPMPPGPG